MRRWSKLKVLVITGMALLLGVAINVSCTSRTQNSSGAVQPATGSQADSGRVKPQGGSERPRSSPTPAEAHRSSARQSPGGPTAARQPDEGPRSARNGTDSGASESGVRTEAALTVEKLSEYQVPAEHLIVSSRHFSNAVVAVALPSDYEKKPEKKYPLVIAFSGARECMKPARQGSLAWISDYKAAEAVRALDSGRLEHSDFRGLATPDELRLFNRLLGEHPYRGVILVCPYSPPLPMGHGLELKEYEEFIIKELVPELKTRYRVLPARVGVDGVSMGGARAMYYGFKYPEIFSTVGSVQGAFGPYMDAYKELVKKNRHILKGRAIQLVTSDRDTMAPSVERMHQMLDEFGVPHQYLKLTGPHDYLFNQGPGAVSLLVFHNQGPRTRASGPVR